MSRIAVVDYGMGNVHSIVKALRLYEGDVVFTSEPSHLRDAHALVLPGDGAFFAAMKNLAPISDIVREHIINERPLLGVCIGFQILFEESDEIPHSEGIKTVPGFGFIPGKIRRFSFAERQYRVPHMGWNQLIRTREEMSDFENEYMYFIHSHRAVEVPPEMVIAWCDYGNNLFPAAAKKGSIFATQFHPEKSHTAGLRIVEKWVKSI